MAKLDVKNITGKSVGSVELDATVAVADLAGAHAQLPGVTADDMKMATRPRARTLFGDWLLEASVLVAVFPIIDQLVVEATFRWRPTCLD